MIMLEKERQQIVEAGLNIMKANYVIGTWGNISMRVEGSPYIVITPSAMDYDAIEPSDVVIADMDGNIIEACRKPSIELPMHLAVYKNRLDVNSIVHTHSEFCTAFALARKPIPGAAEDLVQIIGGEVRVSEYRLPGSEELGIETVKALKDRMAVILANHGLLAVGRNIKEALKVTAIVEKSAKASIYATILGEIHLLSQEDIEYMRDAYLYKYKPN